MHRDGSGPPRDARDPPVRASPRARGPDARDRRRRASAHGHRARRGGQEPSRRGGARHAPRVARRDGALGGGGPRRRRVGGRARRSCHRRLGRIGPTARPRQAPRPASTRGARARSLRPAGERSSTSLGVAARGALTRARRRHEASPALPRRGRPRGATDHRRGRGTRALRGDRRAASPGLRARRIGSRGRRCDRPRARRPAARDRAGRIPHVRHEPARLAPPAAQSIRGPAAHGGRGRSSRYARSLDRVERGAPRAGRARRARAVHGLPRRLHDRGGRGGAGARRDARPRRPPKPTRALAPDLGRARRRARLERATPAPRRERAGLRRALALDRGARGGRGPACDVLRAERRGLGRGLR